MTQSSLKILLADDDDDDCEFFSTALTNIKSHAQVTTLSNGEELITYFKTHQSPIDFIFLDINMPKADGIECLKFIRNIPFYNNTPIIMLSTAATDKLIELTRKYGATAYIEKPCQISDLGKFIHYCLYELKKDTVNSDFLLNTRLKAQLKDYQLF